MKKSELKQIIRKMVEENVQQTNMIEFEQPIKVNVQAKKPDLYPWLKGSTVIGVEKSSNYPSYNKYEYKSSAIFIKTPTGEVEKFDWGFRGPDGMFLGSYEEKIREKIDEAIPTEKLRPKTADMYGYTTIHATDEEGRKRSGISAIHVGFGFDDTIEWKRQALIDNGINPDYVYHYSVGDIYKTLEEIPEYKQYKELKTFWEKFEK